MHIFNKLFRSHQYGNIAVVFRDAHRKPIPQMIYEFLHLFLKSRTLPTHYFASLLYKKGVTNYLDYLDMREIYRIQEILCDGNAVDILSNKLLFQEYYSMRHIRLPRLFAYNFNESGFVDKNGSWIRYDIRHIDSMRQFLEPILLMSGNGSLFIKPIRDSSGKRTRKIHAPTHKLSLKEAEDIQGVLLADSFLIQAEVMQHQELSKLNHTSLNTIRMDTFKAGGGASEILSAVLRVGLAGKHIDNASSGGIFVGIDILNGTLKPHGYTLLSRGGSIYSIHPDSKIPFGGFRLPFFDEVKRLALDAANLIPKAIVGWDIAISNGGPVLIEGNAKYYGMDISDIAYGGYRNNHTFQKAKALANSLAKGTK